MYTYMYTSHYAASQQHAGAVDRFATALDHLLLVATYNSYSSYSS